MSTENKDEKKGEFKIPPAAFRNLITADNSSGFKAEANRYHLYVAEGCPFCSRVTIALNLKGLDKVIDVNYVAPSIEDIGSGKRSWVFTTEGKYADRLFNKKSMMEIYTHGQKDYEGRYSVPLLWDKKTNQIVNNESPDILKFLSEFDELAKNPKLNFRPTNLVKQIDEMNDKLQVGLNTCVYRAGNAPTQSSYNEGVTKVFQTLDELEDILGKNRYLLGETFTECDIRAYVTLVRFDPVYYILFKCSLKRIQDYPNLSNYLRELYQLQPFKDATFMDETIRGYYASFTSLNPSKIAPIWNGNYNAPHNRNDLKGNPIHLTS